MPWHYQISIKNNKSIVFRLCLCLSYGRSNDEPPTRSQTTSDTLQYIE
jgi:hypothetical protein